MIYIKKGIEPKSLVEHRCTPGGNPGGVPPSVLWGTQRKNFCIPKRGSKMERCLQLTHISERIEMDFHVSAILRA